MTIEPWLVYAATLVAAVVVVLTRVRLRGGAAAGRSQVGRRLVDAHTVLGSAALVTWVVLLVTGVSGLDVVSKGAATAIGIVAVGLWWLTAACGLGVLLRWLPSRGSHAADGVGDSWLRGPGLSAVGHLGLAAAVVVLTWAYLVSAV